ncbi:helicase C-terminal domain-containing protein [Streptomyces sp. LHD-70]|uniref:helicase C-terminal domain-containing protein n=1 Tax=Streptomyces sp. LHD-70 TaxID=3072140 RepID=UPI00280D103D|nr:helicase C-terminal domain-containing protein [Streptomyces sp. LHD-70]MDQ8704683.1 helicase C-terminal domain-containing protein [Streptomyces sp. LHD-70]
MTTQSTAGAAAPRTLAEELRQRDDASLATLLRARPDLLSPVPNDLTQLATRAGTRASVVRALGRLDTFALQAAEALAIAPEPATYETLRALLAGDDGDELVDRTLPGTVGTLRDQALVWGGDERLRLVRTVRELLAPSAQHPSPTGLGPTVAESTSGMSPGRLQQLLEAAGLTSTHDPVSAVSALTDLITDRTRMSALLDEAPVDALDVLGRLTWGPPYGQVTAEPAAHLRWLLDRGLLVPTSPGTVVLPREVALHLRGGRAHRTTHPLPPEVAAAAEHRPRVVDATAAGQALAAVATVEELLKEWHEGGPAALRAGGLSVRDLKRTAVGLDVPEPTAAFWVELAYATGLLASDGGWEGSSYDEDPASRRTEERYAATPAYDDWLELPAAERWARLAVAWLSATRTPGLVGGRDGKDRVLSALGPHLDRSAAPEVRRHVLDLLAELPEGAAAAPESVLARLRWERPLRIGAASDPGSDDLRTRLARWTLDEAELLGVTGRGALSATGRALLTDSVRTEAREAHGPVTHGTAQADRAETALEGALAELLSPLLPEPLDHVLLQADLTAVAPGPLERPLAETLGVLADVESKGGATVYRFTPGSVRRALDAGRTATDLHTFLETHSRTPVPQPLSYLIDDVARRHGHLRIGAASAYVRCDDDSVLGEILADKRAAALRLRRLAPTVLAAQADPAALLDGLRSMGFAPSAETPEGDVLIARAHAHRTPPRTAPAPVPEGPPLPDDTLLGAAVRAIRAGDMASTAPKRQAPDAAARPAPGGLPRTTSAETLATMQAAVMTGETLWIGYVNAEGTASQRVIAPVRVEGGFVTAYDHTADEVRTYPLHRVTGVAELAEE